MPAAATHPSERRAQRAAARPARRRAARRAVLGIGGAALAAGVALHHFVPSRAAPAAGASVAGAALPGAAGATGTIALPPAPRGATVAGDPNVVPARPFLLALAGPLDRARALECLTAAVYYEAASESDAGQRAVAQVVLNRVRHPAFPATVCGVVYQGASPPGGQAGGEGGACQFSFACDGSAARTPSRDGWARAARNAAMILTGRAVAPVGLATHYHTYAVTPAWNRTLVMTDAIGAHFFHRWKGYWGTAAAFTRIYRGGEPSSPVAPLPRPDIARQPTVAGITPPPPLPLPPGASARPQGDAALRDDATDRLPQSPILDRWRDSGKPLR